METTSLSSNWNSFMIEIPYTTMGRLRFPSQPAHFSYWLVFLGGLCSDSSSNGLGGISPRSFACLSPASIKKFARFAVGRPWDLAHHSSSSNIASGKVTLNRLLTRWESDGREHLYGILPNLSRAIAPFLHLAGGHKSLIRCKLASVRNCISPKSLESAVL